MGRTRLWLFVLILAYAAAFVAPRWAVASDPAEKARLVALADDKRKAGDQSGALDLYRQARTAGGDDPQLLLTIAVTAHNAQSPDIGREALTAYLKAVPEQAVDTRIVALRAALDKAATAPPALRLTANQRLALGTVDRMVQDLLAAQKDRQPDPEMLRLPELLRNYESIGPRLEDLQYGGLAESLDLWRITGIFALATKDTSTAAWATEALTRLAGDNWDQDRQLADLLPRLNALADPLLLKSIPDERAYLMKVQADGRGSPDDVALAMLRRGSEQKNWHLKLIDYTLVLQTKDVRKGLIARSLLNLSKTHGHQLFRFVRSRADNTRVIELNGAPPHLVAEALVNRGQSFVDSWPSDPARAIADYTRAIELNGALKDQIAAAFVGRGKAYSEQDETGKAIADCTRAIEMKDAPAVVVAHALRARGDIYSKRRDAARAIADFTRVLESRGLPADEVAWVLVARGDAYTEKDETVKAAADFRRVIAMDDAHDFLKDSARSGLELLRIKERIKKLHN